MLGRRLGLDLGGEGGIGKGGEGGLQRCGGKQHMRTVPPRLGVVVVGVDGGDVSPSSCAASSSSPNSFCKDGRKISIGDCALFKPPQDSPPFIGIIRCFSVSKENFLTLGVNWLYRPSEVKLNKGILLEAAPNEIFYSFHKDETPAASLLHPCKVAFLPKGVDLPPGISSFVCRRVYDISSSRLWWLTDQDYINERQEVVNQLLYKTQVEMHATVQPNGHSPKRMNGPTSQLKSGSDCVQNSGSSFPAKGKRRERADQVSEPVKREKSLKMEDAGSVHGRSESFMKHEIAKITGKGGLVDIDGVEKFVQLMFLEREEKRVDLACRSLLAGVIASTEKLDFLNQFVQLKGLSVLDEWLQEVHKGKIGDGFSPRDNDKSVEEFISVSLRALDKLPVNLHALQTCNIGKSVNHLRSHKNAEIQKKARTLVDTWKKRVEDEMNINDTKSGSNQTVTWSARSRQPDISQGGNKQIAGSSDAASKSSGGLSNSKSSTAKLVLGENVCKSSSVSPGSVKSAHLHPLMNTNLKDPARGGGLSSISDVPMTTSRDEKSSGSSQSHNNSQSCSSDHAKAGGISGKEDARSSTAGSGKTLTGPSRHKKSVNGFSGSPASGRDVGPCRNSSLNRGSVTEKVSQSGLTSEKAVDVPAEVNSHKLIVMISSRSRSPAQNASGGSLEEQLVMNSRASSPSPSDRPDQLDPVTKDRVEACQGIVSSEINSESWQSNDLKDMLMSCDDGDGLPDAVLDDERLKAGENLRGALDASKSSTAISCREFKSGRLLDASLGSINALVESCVKLSESSAADSVMDDVGMNLLASVAAGEMLTSEMASPASSPQRNQSTALQPFAGNDQSFNSSADHSSGDAVADTSSLPKIGDCGTTLISTEEMKTSREQLQGVEACTENVRNVGDSVGAIEDCLHKESKADASLSSECKVEDDASKVEVTKEAVEKGSAFENNLVNPVPDDFKDGKKSEKSSDEQCSEDINISQCVMATDLTVKNVQNPANETEGKGAKKESIPLCELKHVMSSCKISSKPPLEDKIVTANSSAHKLTSSEMEEKEHASCAPDAISLPYKEVSTMDAKVVFDLNEGFSADDGKYAEPLFPASARSYILPLVNQLPFPVSSASSILPAPIPPAAAKGSFVPPNDFLRTRVELGWKGSAATSAFRPAEPRKVFEMQLLTAGSGQHSAVGSTRQFRPLLNIDLNFPDDGMAEDAESWDSTVETASLPIAKCERTHNLANDASHGSGGLDLDLNKMNDATDIWSSSANNSCRLDVSLPSVKLSSAARPSGAEAASKRDFDLNDGPVVDGVGAEPSTSSQQVKSSLLSQQPVSNLKMNYSDLGSFSPWFPPGSTLSAVTIPSILPNRGEQPLPVIAAGGQPRMMVPSGGGIPFTHDVYRGSVLSSSPAVSFPSTPFQYNVFPYGPSFSLPPASFSASSTTYIDPSSGGRLCFPPVHSQIIGASSAVTSPYVQPYTVSLQDCSNSFDNSKKWSRPGLDLNTGPGGSEAEGKEDMSSLVPRHFSLASSQALAEDQARMYQVTSGVLKRKEPEGGWDSYKQSWQ